MVDGCGDDVCTELFGSQALFDSHCHVDLLPPRLHEPAYWQAVAKAGVKRLLIPGLQPEQWSEITKIQTAPVSVYCAAGLHPWYISKMDVLERKQAAFKTHLQFKTQLHQALGVQGVIAVGECGLDGHISTPLAVQIPWFEIQVQLAVRCGKPLVVHSRGATQEMLAVLKKTMPPKGGVIHAFSGSYEMAKQYWDRGFYLGVGGTITYPRAKKTRAALAKMPLGALVLETDSPDMPLKGFQGRVNEPMRLPLVAAALAELKATPIQVVAETTTANALRCFGL